MFTGIIEALGRIEDISTERQNRVFWIKTDIAPALKTDESLCHNGVCLTVEAIKDDLYRVTAINETLTKTTAGQWKIHDMVNLERSMLFHGRLDGHIVQGHVDGTAVCIEKKDRAGSFDLTFSFPREHAALVIEKGSVCVNGVSLTAFDVTENTFTVAIIPYTLVHTNLNKIEKGDMVNIEFDILGKYVARLITINGSK